ncbi:MAG: SIS domain-containing protein [Acidobacteria bacterium]|nr:SIS domain-containing protein [Acidobacteriota bacterium]
MRVNPVNGCRLYFELLSRSLEQVSLDEVERLADILLEAYQTEHTVFLFGNGGSAALASHFACDLGKGTVKGTRKRFRAIALTDNLALMTAWANDSDFESIFSEQLENLARAGDVAFAISGSGNSRNVLKALKRARQSGLTTAGLTGFAGGDMRALCDACIVVPSDNMQIIEDLHLAIAHALFTSIRARIEGGPRTQSEMRLHLARRAAP